MNALSGHLLDVRAGGERFVRSGNDHAADIGVGLEAVDGVSEFAHQRGVERVERLRPIEPDQSDPAAGFDNDVVRAHFRLMANFPALWRELKTHFWHAGQKNVERPFCTMRLTVPPAARRAAGLAFAIVDAEIMLEHAEVAVGEPVVAQRRAAGLDRFVEHRLDARRPDVRRVRSARRSGRDRRSPAPRRQPRAIERLADINIAEPGDDALVQQRRLEACLLAPAGAGQHGGVECIAERLGAESLEQRIGVELLPRARAS